MPKLSQLYPSKYLAASDLPEEGMILTIRDVQVERMTDGAEKPVIYFDEIEKGLICNKTNAKAIEKMYGDDTDQWEDERVSLFVTFVDFKGDQVEAIRVKPKKPKPAMKTAPAKAPDGGKKNKAVTQEEIDDMDDDDDTPPF